MFWEKVANDATLGKKNRSNVNPTLLIFQLKNRLGWIDRLDLTRRTPIEKMIEDEAVKEHGVAILTTLSDIAE